MKIAYYVQDGLEQLVLTPETETEKKMLTLLDSDKKVDIHKGSFYECKGGWVRHELHNKGMYGDTGDESRILVLRSPKPSIASTNAA